MVPLDVPSPVGNAKGTWGVPRYHLVLVDQHMVLLTDAAGVTSTAANTMTMMNNLLVHAKSMASALGRRRSRRAASNTFRVSSFFRKIWEGYKPLQTHLENGHAEGKKPYPPTVKGMKTSW